MPHSQHSLHGVGQNMATLPYKPFSIGSLPKQFIILVLFANSQMLFTTNHFTYITSMASFTVYLQSLMCTFHNSIEMNGHRTEQTTLVRVYRTPTVHSPGVGLVCSISITHVLGFQRGLKRKRCGLWISVFPSDPFHVCCHFPKLYKPIN